jgi:hypothetical protein
MEPVIPREIREYLDAVLALNGQRNALLLEALSRIVADSMSSTSNRC